MSVVEKKRVVDARWYEEDLGTIGCRLPMRHSPLILLMATI